MKKLIFGLLATIMFSIGGNAQINSEASKNAALGAQVVTIVNVSKSLYTKGQSYDDFLKNLGMPSPTIPSQDKFFRKVYSYISTNTSDCEILNSDNAEFKSFLNDISKDPRQNTTKNVSGKINSVSVKKKWWQILINTVINVGLDIAVPGNDYNVDLWP